jgi:hypothetical protein
MFLMQPFTFTFNKIDSPALEGPLIVFPNHAIDNYSENKNSAALVYNGS